MVASANAIGGGYWSVGRCHVTLATLELITARAEMLQNRGNASEPFSQGAATTGNECRFIQLLAVTSVTLTF